MGAANHLIPVRIERTTFGLGRRVDPGNVAESLLETYRNPSLSTGVCHEGATTNSGRLPLLRGAAELLLAGVR